MIVQHAAYRRFGTTPGLADLVEHAWVTRHDAPSREVALPDGRGVLLVVVGPPATLVDPLSGRWRTEGSRVRGPSTVTELRELPAGSARLGLQLAPVGLARLRAPRPAVRDAVDAADLLGDDAVAQAADALGRQADEEAVGVLLDAVDRLPRTDSAAADRLGAALASAEQERGLVRSSDLARRAGVPLGELHRWCVHLLGVEPSAWLSAVRFSAFVRETVGHAPVRPADVLAVVRWYVQAGYAPRECERFTGLPPAELRRLVDRLAAALTQP